MPSENLFQPLIDRVNGDQNSPEERPKIITPETAEKLREIGEIMEATKRANRVIGTDDFLRAVEGRSKRVLGNEKTKTGYYALIDMPQVFEGKQKGIVAVGHIPKGHRAPVHMHRGGEGIPGVDFGEVTQTVAGRLYFVDEKAGVLSTNQTSLRVSPKDTPDIYLAQDIESWTGGYVQPVASQTGLTPEEFANIQGSLIRSIEDLVYAFRG